ncbi:MAG: helix-turn-helix domain-containing protein [Propionibacteriaceae bacterium]|nr:helix-turn-helix domain-containing protein [Propionibacteriaceae bacterium]
MDAATIVKRVRALSGVTRKELAELAGLAPSTVGRIEQGALDPTWGTLSRILEATGHRINGDTVVSAGDQSAIAAARPLLASLLVPASPAITKASVPTRTIKDAGAGDVGGSLADKMAKATRTANASTTEAFQQTASTVKDQWLGRWTRAGWLSDRADADDVVNVAVVAGNAGKIARRNVVRRNVSAPDGWRALARRLDEAGVDYAVSGLVAARPDRATATAASPMIYVADPSLAVTRLGLEETAPGRGVLLIAPSDDELLRTEVDGGIRFVSRAQGVLDAFAGSGREPDKAEDTLRSLLAVSA